LAGQVLLAPETVTYAAHSDGVKSMLSVAENLQFWADVHGVASIEAAMAAMNLSGLAHRRAAELSAGQRRRLGLARLMVTGRWLWLLDEPTVSLDAASVALFGAMLKAHLGQGGAAVIATHIDLGIDDATEVNLQPFAAKDHIPGLGADMKALLLRDLTLAFRSGGGFGLALAFFLLVAVLVPLGVGPDGNTLGRIAPGILWVGALLSCLLSLDRVFALDYEDGSLDLLAASALPLEGAVLAKALAHWLVTGLPLTLVAPVLALMLNLPLPGFFWLVVTLALGTPALSIIGTFGAALVVGVKRGGLLMSLLVLPLYVPTLIFGAEVVRRGALGADPLTPLALMAAITASSWALLPYAAAAAIRISLR
jgi:heme exporter protein B